MARELRPASVRRRGLDPVDTLIPKCIETRALLALVLRLVYFRRLGIGEDACRRNAVDQHGDSGHIGRACLAGHLGDMQQRVSQSAVVHKELGKGAEGVI